MRKIILLVTIAICAIIAQSKTLVVYYSYTNNVERIVRDLTMQIDADVIEIEPAEKGLDYAANNYAIGSALISAIRNNPNDATSYPAIDPVEVDLTKYDCVIIGAPLWWSNMAAPLQTFLFQHGKAMAEKKIGLIVSSASSGISGVEADAKRLIPKGDFITPSLWIRSSQTLNCHSMIENWLEVIHYNEFATAIDAISDHSAEILFKTEDDMLCVSGNFRNIAIYNINGNKILETDHHVIPTKALTPGMYIAVVLDSKNSPSSHKLLIK